MRQRANGRRWFGPERKNAARISNGLGLRRSAVAGQKNGAIGAGTPLDVEPARGDGRQRGKDSGQMSMVAGSRNAPTAFG